MIIKRRMNQVVMFNGKTVGRDKLARLIQYASKLTWHILQRCNADGSSISKMKELEYILGNFRKLLRMGRCLDHLYIAMRMINNEDTLVSFNCAVSKVSFALYLLCDHIIWFGRYGFIDVDTTRWNRFACKYWLFTIIMNLTRDYQEIKRLLANGKISFKYNINDPKLLFKNFLIFSETHRDIVLDTVKNTCDIFLPLAALNYIRLSPGAVGFLGVISSVAGIYTVLDPFAKLPFT